MGPTRVFKSTYGRVLTIGAVVVAAAALVSMVATGGLGEVARYAGLPLAGALAAWALFWRPEVSVSDGEIVLCNVLRTVRIPWPAFRGVGSTLALTVTTTDGTFTAWSAPARSGSASRLPSPRRKSAEAVADEQPKGTGAEAAAFEIARRHAALTAAGHLGASRPAVGTTTSWHVRTIVASGVLVTWSMVAILAG